MEFKDYERLSELLKEVDNVIDTFSNEELQVCIRKHPSYAKHYTEANKSLRKLKSHLENMMFLEYPKQATTSIFYPDRTPQPSF